MVTLYFSTFTYRVLGAVFSFCFFCFICYIGYYIGNRCYHVTRF